MLGLFLHAGVAVFMGLWIFSLLMMTLLLSYLPGVAIRERIFGTASNGQRLGFRFNPQSDRQARAVALAKAMDFDGRLDPVSVSSNQPSVRVMSDGQEASGPAAATVLFNTMGWLRPVRWLLFVPGLGGLITRWFTGEAPRNGVVSVNKPHLPAAS
jgi:hypothetical protein